MKRTDRTPGERPEEQLAPRHHRSRRAIGLVVVALGIAATLATILPSGAVTGTITTLAGKDVYPPFNPQFDGDGPATDRQLRYPTDADVDAAGTVYLPDSANFRIRKISGGVITTIAGTGVKGANGPLGEPCVCGDGGPAIAAQFVTPRAVAVNPAGTLLFVSDSFGLKYRLINLGAAPFTGYGVIGLAPGAIQVFATNIFAGEMYFHPPTGDLYITDGRKIRRITPGGGGPIVVGKDQNVGPVFYSGDGGPALDAVLDSVGDMALDPAGNIVIADSGNQRIRFVNMTAAPITRYGKTVAPGNIDTIAGPGPVDLPALTCTENNGRSTNTFSDGSSALTATLSACLNGVRFTSNLDVLFSDSENGFARIRKITTAGGISTVAGTGLNGYPLGQFAGDGITATSSNLFHPMGMAFDPAGNLVFADTNNRRIRMIEGPL